jgi:Tfp pilus assembly protein PilZ
VDKRFMNNQRWGKRFNAELKARFGTEDYNDIAVVQDISPFGLFLVTPKFFAIGTLLNIQIRINDSQFIQLEGRVHWSKERPPNLTWETRDAGMGIKIEKILQGRDLYENLCQNLCKAATTESPASTPSELSRGHEKKGLFKRLFRF